MSEMSDVEEMSDLEEDMEFRVGTKKVAISRKSLQALLLLRK